MQDRQEQIHELVRRRGFASIDALARRFDVSPQTIRRDIKALCERNLLARFHGGAGLPSSVENIDYTTRKVMRPEAKRRIARLLASHVPDNASLFINIGTTNEAVARALVGHKGLRVITNNLHVASILGANPDFEVIVAGGTVRSRDGGIIGEATIDFVSQFRVDIGVIGISGIDADGTLLDFDYREVRVAQAIIAHSRRVFLATDHSKFGRNAMVRLGSLAQLDALFTDQPVPRAIDELLAAEGVACHIAETADDIDE